MLPIIQTRLKKTNVAISNKTDRKNETKPCSKTRNLSQISTEPSNAANLCPGQEGAIHNTKYDMSNHCQSIFGAF